MPADGVLRRLRSLQRQDHPAGRPSEIGPADVVHLARYFGSSYEATLWHLVQLQLLARARYDALRTERPEQWARRLGYAADETPEALVLPPEYVRLALAAYQTGRVSLPRLAELLHTSPLEADAVVAEAGVHPAQPALKEWLDDVRRA